MKYKKNGFGLVEVLIAAGLLGGLALVATYLFQMQSRNSTKANLDSDVLLITNEIVAILSDQTKCTNIFFGRNALSTTTGITNINTKYYTIGSGSAPSGGYGNGKVQIDNYTISSTPTELLNQHAVLNIFFKNKTVLKGSSGPSNVAKKINLHVEVDSSNNILRCRSLSSSSTDIWTRGTGGDIYYTGDVGIGTSNPQASLDVAGTVKIGTSTASCSSASEGTMKYDYASKNMQFCNGTSWRSMGGDFTTPPNSPTTYCILSRSCPAGWVDRGVVGIIAAYAGNAYGLCGNGNVGSTGSDFNGTWGWCHPRLCCNN